MPLFGISIQFLQSNIFSRSRGFTEFPMSCHFSAQKDSPGAGLSQNSVSWSRHKASLLTAWRLLFSRGPGPVMVGGAMALRSLRRLALAQARWRGQGVSFHPARRRFFDEVWGLSFLGLSEKIQEDEGSLFLDNFKSNPLHYCNPMFVALVCCFPRGWLDSDNNGTAFFPLPGFDNQ